MGRPRKVQPTEVIEEVAASSAPEEVVQKPGLTMEEIEEIFRDNLLDALDLSAAEAFGTGRDSGAKDRDLPALFAALDVQIETLIKRYKVEVKK